MSEFLTVVVVLLGVIVITAVVFCAWLMITAIKLVVRGVSALLFGGMPRLPRASYQCTRRTCQAENPASARFCRRCGQELLRRELARQHGTYERRHVVMG